ncbi:MAG TPA: hypothetical protein VF533_05500 [Solirubrobacteraceae bacterium]
MEVLEERAADLADRDPGAALAQDLVDLGRQPEAPDRVRQPVVVGEDHDLPRRRRASEDPREAFDLRRVHRLHRIVDHREAERRLVEARARQEHRDAEREELALRHDAERAGVLPVGADVERRLAPAPDALEPDVAQLDVGLVAQLLPVGERLSGDRREALGAQIVRDALEPRLGGLRRLQVAGLRGGRPGGGQPDVRGLRRRAPAVIEPLERLARLRGVLTQRGRRLVRVGDRPVGGHAKLLEDGLPVPPRLTGRLDGGVEAARGRAQVADRRLRASVPRRVEHAGRLAHGAVLHEPARVAHRHGLLEERRDPPRSVGVRIGVLLPLGLRVGQLLPRLGGGDVVGDRSRRPRAQRGALRAVRAEAGRVRVDVRADRCEVGRPLLDQRL